MIHLSDRDAAYVQGGLSHKRSKYHNTPTVVDGITFDSKAEAARYEDLRLLCQAGDITDLRVHPVFIIVDKDEHGGFIRYEADFQYRDWTTDGAEYGGMVVEDVKGGRATQTPLWRIKWRLVQQRFPDYVFRVVQR